MGDLEKKFSNKNENYSKNILNFTNIFPKISSTKLLETLQPPPQFSSVSFTNYIADPQQNSQTEALLNIINFSKTINKQTPKKIFGLTIKKQKPTQNCNGIYLDGGFGVGKTHLLAALWHNTTGSKAFGSFVNYTNLVGALGFKNTISALKKFSLVCIDEFELDDPGDTVMMSRLMRELTDAGVKLAATSNTLPNALGEGRFAAQDFNREIQTLAKQFLVIRIDGKDYRHRDSTNFLESTSTTQIQKTLQKISTKNLVTTDNFSNFLQHIEKIHPSKYKFMLNNISCVFWHNIFQIINQNVALRFVAFVDCLYDANIPIIVSGSNLAEIFSTEILKGGYQKKYYRALSRLLALQKKGAKLNAQA